jgi:hypothetical protein
MPDYALDPVIGLPPSENEPAAGVVFVQILVEYGPWIILESIIAWDVPRDDSLDAPFCIRVTYSDRPADGEPEVPKG